MPAIYKNGLLYAGTSSGSGANTDIIADEYTEKTYAVGDYCIHEDALYKCNTAITVAESWTAAHWTEKDIATELKAINSTISTLGTASTKNVPSSGNAGNTEVVLGNDTRLSDSRPASDVSSWAKASTKPSYTASEVGALPDNTVIPTITDTYSGTSSDGMSGKAVKSAIDALDVSAVGGSGKYISTISEADGKISATAGNIDTTVTSGSSNLVTSGAVFTAIDNLPEPMVFKGSLGTGGTITALPVNGTASVGDTYKVITDGTYASQAAKVGDTFICDSKTASANTWTHIPSGDEPSGTVTSVGISNGGGISVSGSPITSSGTITISHADTSSQASVDNSGRTYIQDITLDTYGHVTGISSATETITNTDRYVNSASFADDTTSNSSSPVKMTLTRAGSDTVTVTGNIPKVSNSSAGVVPKGTTVTTQDQTTKFLREDGTWAAPSYTDASGFMTKANPTGTGSFSLNRKANTTVGNYSTAEGYNCTANGSYSHAEGNGTTASGYSSHAEGNGTTVSSNYAHAEGSNTTANGQSSHAEGNGTTTSANSSHAEGAGTTASGDYSHAEGNNTTASDTASHAEGNITEASGSYSHAEGSRTIASGDCSHAEGRTTTAQRRSQHVFGEYNVLDTTGTTTTRGNYVEIVGNGTGTSARSNARTLDWSGNEVLAGSLTTTGINLPSGSTWDGTNTSLASAISAIRSNMYNIPVDPSDTSNMNIWIETT